MENKYYTPSIEEFRVGFEYEELEKWRDNSGKTTWSKCKISNAPMRLQYVHDMYFAKRESLCFRVKSLDKDDIEDVGFEHTDSSYYRKENIHVWFPDSKDLTRIVIQDMNKTIEIVGMHYRYTCFDGILKNKSELMDQLKRCGVYEQP
jgi:hypothetical protein